MILFLRRLAFGCLLGHDYLRDRNDHQELILRCQRCNSTLSTFQSKVIRGPKHPERKTTEFGSAQAPRRANVSPFQPVSQLRTTEIARIP